MIRITPSKWGSVSGVLITRLLIAGYMVGVEAQETEEGENTLLSVWFNGARPRKLAPFKALERMLEPAVPEEKWVRYSGRTQEGRVIWRYRFMLDRVGEEEEQAEEAATEEESA